MSKLSYNEILKKEYSKEENKLDQEEIDEKVEAAKIQGDKAITLLKEELGAQKKQLRLAYKAPQLNFTDIREVNKSITKIESDIELQTELNAELFPKENN
jgi:hypothetical protein